MKKKRQHRSCFQLHLRIHESRKSSKQMTYFLKACLVIFVICTAMDSEETLYDEFGNYIGPALDDDIDDDIAEENGSSARFERREPSRSAEPEDSMQVVEGKYVDLFLSSLSESSSTAVILHEDKKYYPDADEVYPGVETMVQDEDAQPIEQPIIAPIKTKKFDIVEKATPSLSFDAK